jgi:hypothetical protein
MRCHRPQPRHLFVGGLLYGQYGTVVYKALTRARVASWSRIITKTSRRRHSGCRNVE